MTDISGRRRPNIVVCMSDQLRPFELGCYGGRVVSTPNIDALAHKGTRFQQAITNNPVCVPARSIVLSGQYSRTCSGSLGNQYADHRHRLPRERIRLTEPTIAEELRSVGYSTALIGKWHNYSDPLIMGFDYAVHPAAIRGHHGGTYFVNEDEVSVGHMFVPDFEISMARDFLREDRNRPFFMFYNINPPHMPLLETVPSLYTRMYTRDEVHLRPNVHVDNAEEYGAWPRHLLLESRDSYRKYWFRVYLYDGPFINEFRQNPEGVEERFALPPGFELEDLTALYCGAVKWVDDIVGELVSALREAGVLESTVIIFTSDHGDNLGSHGLFNKDRLFEESIRIPFIVTGPEIRRQVITSELAKLIDVMPTVLQLAGAGIPPRLQGRSLAPSLTESHAGDATGSSADTAFIETPFYEIGIRTMRYMYGMRLSDEQEVADELYLFDLERDPYQLENVLKDDEYSGVRTELQRRLIEWHVSTPWHAVEHS